MTKNNHEKVRTIYMLRNKVNGKEYIGLTIDFEKRKRSHYNKLKNPNAATNKELQKDFDNGSWDDFEFIELKKVKGLDKAMEVENELIKKYQTAEKGYNVLYNARRAGGISNNIKDFMSPSEASYRWGIHPEAFKEKLKPSRNQEEIERLKKDGLIKSFKRPGGKRNEWIISRDAMELWYGKEK